MEEIYTFAGNPLDRVSQRRQDAAWIASLLDDPETRLLPFRELKPVVRDPSATTLDWQPVAPWRAAIDSGKTLVLLGIGEGRAYFALDANGVPPANGVEEATADVRGLATAIPGPEAAILAEARSALDWHVRHGFCAQCGTASAISSGGWGRRCPNCRAHHYPRVDPVVIMLAVRGERCLLGRNRRRVGSPDTRASRALWSRAKPSRRRYAAKSWRSWASASAACAISPRNLGPFHRP